MFFINSMADRIRADRFDEAAGSYPEPEKAYGEIEFGGWDPLQQYL
ncbi:hypothetical protein [Enterocloster clostridioformis]|nr:hypothetical protein [Enterocloster clostridioformis]